MPDSPASASVTIRRSAGDLYDLVTDVAGMGRFSPECTGGHWLDGATGPAVGARFKGTNRRGFARWSTVNRVVAAEPGRVFSFETDGSGARWTYRFEPAGDGATVVTESREMFRKRPATATFFATLFLGGTRSHDDEMDRGLLATLERIKAHAEG
ncbi:MAG: SRPBCC family protein [Microthrixaceae bacterium]